MSMSLKYLWLKNGGNERKSIKVTFGSFLREIKEKNINNKQLLSDFIKLINVIYKYNVILN